MTPMTMPAMAPEEMPELAGEGVAVEEGEAEAEAAVLAAEEEAALDDEDEADAELVGEALLLPGSPDMVEMVPRKEEMEPTPVREAEGAGVLSCVSVDIRCGAGAWTVKSEGCWQLR